MNTFTKSYCTCALWSSCDKDGTPLDSDYSIEDIHPTAIVKMTKDCDQFQSENVELIKLAKLTTEQAGHSFWLSRNGHGSGFFDEYSQTTCETYNKEQAIAIVSLSRDFSKRDELNKTCQCPYHACQRLQDIAKAYGSCDMYLGDDGQIYI